LPKQLDKVNDKAMHKSNDANETRNELYKKFQETRGAITAFCRERQITDEWMRLVFKGQYEDLDLLIAAADFLKKFKDDKTKERTTKESILRNKVTEISMA